MTMTEADRASLPPATERSSYKLWTYDKLRYGDTDRQGHVNNAVYATFCESGRVAIFHDEGLRLLEPGTDAVIVRLEIDYRAELYYPGVVDIATRVLAIGRTSFRFGQGIFSGGTCAATAEAVGVLMDDATRKATPLTPQFRAWLEENLAR